MGPYLILDGYNIIGALERYRRACGLEDARGMLINDALKAAGWTGGVVVAVFDAQRSPEARSEQRYAGGRVRIIYTAPGETADDYIGRMVSRLEGEEVTLYTADYDLQRGALAHGASRAAPREFGELLDELPATTRHPDTVRKRRLLDSLSPEARRAMEELRRGDHRE